MATLNAYAYQVERRRLFRQRMLVATSLALVLVPIFALSDYVIYRSEFATLFAARLLSFAVTAGILVALYSRRGKRYVAWLGLVLAATVGLAIAGVPIYVTGVVDTPHYVSTALLLLSVAALLPWAASEVVILAAVLTVTFLGAAVLHGPLVKPVVLALEVSTLVVTGGLAVLIASLAEQARGREFTARRALRAVAREKTRLVGDLQQKSEALQRLNVEMEDLLYVSSHDLRAPLINVQGFAREVSMGLADLTPYVRPAPEAAALRADLEDSLRFITSASQRMDALVGGLLDVSRITTRTSPSEEVNLARVLEKVIDSFRYQLDQHRVHVTVGPLPTVRGDPVRLNQVFSNLVDNAIKYMGDSPCREIEIGMRNAQTPRVLFVRDTGPGIPPDSQDAVFRLFRRLGNGVPGDGLGLTAVRKIVERHGGRIWIESTPGRGCTFCFTLWERP